MWGKVGFRILLAIGQGGAGISGLIVLFLICTSTACVGSPLSPSLITLLPRPIKFFLLTVIRARVSGEFITSYRSDSVLYSVVGCKLAAQTLILLSIEVDWSPVHREDIW